MAAPRITRAYGAVNMGSFRISAMIAALLLATATPDPGALKTFGDWAVGCDNARRCEAAALAPDGEDRATYLMLVVRREAAGPASCRTSH